MWYLVIEKLALALVTLVRKLRPYFQRYLIMVVTLFFLKSILYKLNLSGHLTKWVVEVREFDGNFQPRTSIKSQVLMYFVAELTQ